MSRIVPPAIHHMSDLCSIVNMNYEETGMRFSLWNKHIGRFYSIGNIQAWRSLEDFRLCCEFDHWGEDMVERYTTFIKEHIAKEKQKNENDSV